MQAADGDDAEVVHVVPDAAAAADASVLRKVPVPKPVPYPHPLGSQQFPTNYVTASSDICILKFGLKRRGTADIERLRFCDASAGFVPDSVLGCACSTLLHCGK